MERILLIGCGGAGKSTLARQLGEKLDLPVIHLDKIFWRPGWEHISQAELDAALEKIWKQEKWIMDGNYGRTLPQRLQHCDTVIWLDFSRLTCILGVAKRILTTYGTVRPDMGEGCPERLDWDFLKWVWNFNREHREEFYAMVQKAGHAQVHILKNRRQVKRLLQSLEG